MDISNISPAEIKEICREYERAESQTRQIQISSELHLLTKEQIRAILESQGYNPPKVKTNIKEQRKPVLITYNGKTQTLTQWSKETGIYINTLRSRYSSGWDVESIFKTPVKGTRKNA